jgi:hypothetical protein
LIKSFIGRLIATKALAAAAVVALAGGGIAVAATTGTASHGKSASAQAKVAARHASETDSEGPETEPAEPSESGEADGTPTPSLEGLCHAFQAGATSNPGKAIDNPAFSVLVAAAGGKDKLAAYCENLIGAPRSHPNGQPSDHPSHPAGAGQSHGHGPPSDLPTHPGGEPTD